MIKWEKRLYVPYHATREQIIRYLTESYEQICTQYPLTRDMVSLQGYIHANYKYALRNSKQAWAYNADGTRKEF